MSCPSDKVQKTKLTGLVHFYSVVGVRVRVRVAEIIRHTRQGPLCNIPLLRATEKTPIFQARGCGSSAQWIFSHIPGKRAKACKYLLAHMCVRANMSESRHQPTTRIRHIS